jgi:predicted metal-dependent HD superfamily phosphohydrolase
LGERRMSRQTPGLQEMANLTTLYTQPHRYYHNINHINDCLVELENFVHPDFTNDKRSMVEAAIWYHDAVYNPYSKLNEFNSAELVYGHQSAFVRDIIKYTARHLEDVSADIEKHIKHEYRQCVQVMLDIDLAGFGKDRMVFAMNGMNIRHEYYNTHLRDFLEGRQKFYQELIKRPTLYYTKYFYDKYHDVSRDNIRWEMLLIDAALRENDVSIWSRSVEISTNNYF